MSAALLQLAFREKSTQRIELYLLDELTESEILTREQKIKASQIGLGIAKNTVEMKRYRGLKWYVKNRVEKLRREKERYHATLEMKEKKRIQSKKWRHENPKRAFEISKAWRNRNPEAVKQMQNARYLRQKFAMTVEEWKIYQREKNRKAKARKIEKIGIDAYRAAERERVKRHYAANPEALKRNRANQKESARLRRQQKKEKQC